MTITLAQTACSSVEEVSFECQTSIESGLGEAKINNDEWTTDSVKWSSSPTGVQLNFPPSDGYHITVVGQKDTLGQSFDDSDYPMEISLLSGSEGGWAVIYYENDSESTKDGNEMGTLWLESIEDGEQLKGCFEFSTESFSVTNGYFAAESL